MLKFRPTNPLTQRRSSISFNELQLIALIEKGLSDNSLRGFLYKRSSPNAKWRLKWFLLFENLLFYFDVGPNVQQQQQQQQSAQQQPGQGSQSLSSAGSKSRTFGSLIRRQNTKSTRTTSCKEPSSSCASSPLKHSKKLDASCPASKKSRRSSASETIATGNGQSNGNKQDVRSDNDNQLDGEDDNDDSFDSSAKKASGEPFERAEQPGRQGQSQRGRLSSDPQTSYLSNGNNKNLGQLSSYYNEAGSSKTLNSSSISGVSGHFLAHNEQTIGRSTTTTAGKTATSAANYSSLLSRKIGVIFLEGSYCERLVDTVIAGANASQRPAGQHRPAGLLSSGEQQRAPSGQQVAVNGRSCSAAGAKSGSQQAQAGQQQQGLLSTIEPADTSPSVSRCEHFVGLSPAHHNNKSSRNVEEFQFDCVFMLTWKKEGSKEYQFRTETEAECVTWVHAISNARYSTLLNDKEQLEQKYLHLSQIIESESTAKWQYSKQCEEFLLEIKKLRQEICLLKRQESRSNQLRLVLSKSAAIVDAIVRQQRRRQRQQQLKGQPSKQPQQQEAGRQQASPISSRGPKTLLRSNTAAASMNGAGKGARASVVVESLEESNTEVSGQRGHSPSPLRRPEINNEGPAAVAASESMATLASAISGFEGTGAGELAARQELLAKRTRSIEQEQEEQELLVRRTRRCNSRLSSLCSQSGRSPSPPVGSPDGHLQLQQQHLQRLVRLSTEAACGFPGGAELPLGHQGRQQRSNSEAPRSSAGSPAGAARTKLATSSSPYLCSSPSGSPRLPVGAGNLRARAGHLFERADDSLGNSLDVDLVEVEDVDEGLRKDLKRVVSALNSGLLLSAECLLEVENDEEIKKIKKVQGFFRGWLCRRRWKQIVQEYIKSPHAESMRKRNNLVFRMVECEEEYVEQLTLLISAFLRPIKMAASSQRPALNHDELNSIFLNSETLLFLHQIFLKGLTARMESWPTLVLGDLFNMLLPMLQIYQEYVRNHHFSLQVLAECKQREQFSLILRRLEEKPQLNGRTLETFLTYPMHQIPRYIICLHEILAHTPHNHVERKSLYEAQTKLEELSRQMHDEVSETENIRQNLAIERMIIGGCDILLDVNQVFVRQGILMQVVEQGAKSGKSTRSRLTSFASRSPTSHHHHHCQQQQQEHKNQQLCQNQQCHFDGRPGAANPKEPSQEQACRTPSAGNSNLASCSCSACEASAAANKELIRQCFLFTNHLLLCTRTKDGKLHLLENIGRLSLCEVTLIENPQEFVQQQESLISNLELFQAQQRQQQQEEEQQLIAGTQQSPLGKRASQLSHREELAGNRSVQEGASGISYLGSDKRASTASAPAKWTLQAGRQRPGERQNRVEFDESQDNRRLHSMSSPGQQSEPELLARLEPEWAVGEQRTQAAHLPLSGNKSHEIRSQQPSGKLSRGRLAGYLANKLSNLTNLGGGSGSGQQQQGASSSAPPSPQFKKAGPPASQPHAKPLRWYPLSLSKDYGGCDFILLLEPTSVTKTGAPASDSTQSVSAFNGSSGKDATLLGSSTSNYNSSSLTFFGSSGSGAQSHSANNPLIIHLVAPNLQEKAAWMSDISQPNEREMEHSAAGWREASREEGAEQTASALEPAANSPGRPEQEEPSRKPESQDQDSSSAASVSKGAGTRRRRLAHRRQYAKSRRLASPFLRSQFVHYDNLKDRYEPEDSWFRVQTFDNNEPSSELDSAGHSRVMLSELGHSCHHHRQQRVHSATCGTLPCFEPDLTLLERCPPPTPTLASLCAGYSSLGQQEHDEFLVNYSSGSLESCSFIEGQQQIEASSSMNILKSPLELAGSAATAKSLSYLANLDSEARAQADRRLSERNAKLLRKYNLHGSTDIQAPKSSAAAAERVVRSETIDLNRVGSRHNASASSPKSKFFPPRVFQHKQQQQQQPHQAQQVSSLRGPHVGERYVSLHNLVYSSSDSSQSQTMTSEKSRSHPKDCIDNVHFNDLFHGSVNDSSSVTMNQSVRTDPRLYKDDVDIKFSRALNSCKLPQIRYASKERLFERLTDLRFLSIDFLNTFLLTYRVFTTAEDVLEALKSVHYNCDRYFSQQQASDQQRDSFCAFPADLAAGSLACTRAEQQSSQPEESGEPARSAQRPGQQPPLQAKQQPAPGGQQKPTVPPRSSGSLAMASQAGASGDQSSGKFLSAPSPTQHQKRRSTISALTPITGSSSSSLVNLQLASKSSTSTNQQDVFAERLGSRAEVDSHSATFSNSDDLSTLMLCLESQSPKQQAFADRTRSSSMTPTSGRQLLQMQPNLSEKAANCLSVPGGREVRASSLSHISEAKNIVGGRTILSTTMTSPRSVGNEHWRLSYKKTSSTTNVDQLSPGAGNQFLSANYGGPKGQQQPTRRASSSDVSVTFHVTLEPPPAETGGLAREEEEESRLASFNQSSCSSVCPTVPPSSPVEPAPADESPFCDPGNQLKVAGRKTKSHAKSSNQTNDSTSGSSSFLPSAMASSSSSPINSASTKSVLTSQSESGLINSTSSFDSSSSSSEEAGQKRSPEEYSSRIRHNGVEKKSARKGEAQRELGGEAHIQPTSVRARRKSSKLNENVKSFILKEIDYNDSNILDTSADSSTGNEEDEEFEQDDDERSFKILTKLNSVKITGSDSDDSEESPRKSAGGRPRTGRGREGRRLNEKASGKPLEGKESAPLPTSRQPLASELETSRATTGTQADEHKSQAATDCSQQVPGAGRGSNSVAHSISSMSRVTTPRSSFQYHPTEGLAGEKISKAGVIVTSSAPRITSRRSSTASAASAFAAATAAANNPILTQPPISCLPAGKPAGGFGPGQQRKFSSNELAHSRCLAQNSNQLVEQAAQSQLSESSPCLCSNFRRSSFTQNPASIPPKQQPGRALHQHHPTCAYFQQQVSGSPSNTPLNSYPVLPHSDASSLCNSRASSRLSSCAGLEYSSYSSAPVNFYASSQHQQFVNMNSSGQQARSQAGPRGQAPPGTHILPAAGQRSKRNSTQINIRSVATIRVLSVLRHWVSKHSQDFVNDAKLFHLVQEFLQSLIVDSSLLPAEHKAAVQLQQMVQKAVHSRGNQVDLDLLLAPPAKPSPDSIETLSALEIAEGMTYLDHKIFLAMRSEEFLGQAWMKMDKAIKAPHILLITKRFNDVSRLVSSEIIRVQELHRRVAVIEKWTNVAHICRVVHNFNGVLQICAAFTNSAVFRLKKTWDKIPKTTRTTIDQLQNLVSTDSRFRNMRDAINRCDPPSIPYVGMYLTDLSFIEEGTPNYSPDGLLNFSKMRMIAHVIREIQHLQNGSYKIELNPRVANYLLDGSRHLQDDEMYRCSLVIEPRSSGAKNGVQILNSVSSQYNGTPNQQHLPGSIGHMKHGVGALSPGPQQNK